MCGFVEVCVCDVTVCDAESVYASVLFYMREWVYDLWKCHYMIEYGCGSVLSIRECV